MTPHRPLRVCHIAYSFYEFDNRVLRYVDTLATRGDHVDVITLRRPEAARREDVGNTHIYRIQRRTATERRALTYLLKILWFSLKSTVLVTALQMRRRYDLVHVHNIPDFLVFVAWLPKLMGARVILDIHDVVPELYAGKFEAGGTSRLFNILVAMERACCRFADQVIVANHLWRDKLVARSVPAAKCTTILNYPDLSVFKPVARGAEANGRPFLILYPGSLNHHQGLDIAIRAFATVKPQMPNAEFHIYGRGPALEELKRLSQELGLQDAVKFMPQIGITEIAAVMAAADVGIVPKRSDGFGNEAFSTKILEFMGCGVPVIVSRTRIDQHYFNDDLVTFFEPGDDRDLARALLSVYGNRAGQAVKVRAAQEFSAKHSWQVRSSDYKSLVDSVIEGETCASMATV